MRGTRIRIYFGRSMELIIFIGVALLPYTLGHTDCFSNVELKNVTSTKLQIACSSACGKADVHLPDGSRIIVRGCGEHFTNIPALLLRSDLRTLSESERTALSRMSSRDLHLCKEDLCNEAHLIVSTLWLVIITVIAAIIRIDCN
ncbi:uncharacterized protein [Fopius arisanus]|uniref:Uncharacterized protein n=1 Tax=Fopius arisanus TaxID=64838 RepID=A0A9R1T712_9HYME|nr:PREDICTED: uncharacterized protein LOC105266872 [Fopius arisanus]